MKRLHHPVAARDRERRHLRALRRHRGQSAKPWKPCAGAFRTGHRGGSDRKALPPFAPGAVVSNRVFFNGRAVEEDLPGGAKVGLNRCHSCCEMLRKGRRREGWTAARLTLDGRVHEACP